MNRADFIVPVVRGGVITMLVDDTLKARIYGAAKLTRKAIGWRFAMNARVGHLRRRLSSFDLICVIVGLFLPAKDSKFIGLYFELEAELQHHFVK